MILNGSPRPNGDTVFIINKLTQQLDGEIKIINAYTADISPCVDCRKCRETSGSSCIINDNMQEIYDYLITCDNVVIASPIYFSELTGKLLDIASRFQRYFSQRRFRHEKPELKPKKGAVLLTGGGTGDPFKPYGTAVCIFKCINVQDILPLICTHNTDNVPANQDPNIPEAVKAAADFLNSTITR